MGAMSKEMNHARKRLLEDFLIPALDSEKYGHKLFWLDKEKGTFRLYWSHKNAAKWTAEDTIVFQDWDKLKGHYKPEDKNYFMCCKQRLRAALYKLSPYVKPLKSKEKFYRDYQLIFDGDKKQCGNHVRLKPKTAKKTAQKSIPTSVIRENTSYIAKPAPENQKQSLSPKKYYTPSNFQVLAQYSSSMSKIHHLHISRQSEKKEKSPKSPKELHDTSVLRENSSNPRIPHIPTPEIPVFRSFHKSQTCPRNFHVFPEVFVSKIYNGPENVPQIKTEIQTSMDTTDDLNPGILNLSTRSDACNNAPSR